MEAELPVKMKPMTDAELLALPVTVGIETAGRAWGFGRTKSQQLAREEKFPCQVLTYGNRRIVTKAALLAALGVEWHPAASAAPGTAA